MRVEFTDKTEPAVAVVSQTDTRSRTRPTLALKKQLATLRTSERASAPSTPSAWRSNSNSLRRSATLAGMAQPRSGRRRHSLSGIQSLAHGLRLCRLASDEAAEHHQRGTEAHRQATKEIFDRHLGHQQAQPVASVEPTPAFFEPPEPSRSPAVPDRAAVSTARLSLRRDAGGPREPQHPRQVKLSPIEQEIARNLGLSDVAYAEGKLAMQRRKASGELQ